MKRILFIISFYFASVLSSYAQVHTLDGANPAWEGSTITYTFTYYPDYPIPFPDGLRASFHAENGEVINEQTQLFAGQPVTVTIHWNCLVTEGEIKITISGTTPLRIYDFYWYHISINSGSTYPDFCNEISPAEQYVDDVNPPAALTVTNCSPSCESTYGFTYEWEYADITASDPYATTATWQTIVGASGSAYVPALPPPGQMQAYRRITIYTDPNSTDPLDPPVRKYSKPAFIRYLVQLDPGTISTSTPLFHSYHNIPVITSSPATGGFCDPVNYIYTWQSTNETGAWIDIGTGETFPDNTEEITYTKKYRRKIDCNTEIQHTNEITVQFDYISDTTENRNYVREVDVHVPGKHTFNQVEGELTIGEKFQTTTYLDGFGRPIQKVSRETGTPAPGEEQWLDNVQFFQYDQYGRQPYQYLPYSTIIELGKFKTTPLDEQVQYYNTNAGTAEGEHAFSINSFENSPLNRIINTKSPGKAWHDAAANTADIDYPINQVEEKVPLISIGWTENDIPVFEGYYKEYTLIKTKTEDVNKSHIITYTNKSGLTVLRKVQLKTDAGEYLMNSEWICTYYVYDDFGRLRYTLEPKAVEYFNEHSWVFNSSEATAILDGLCFKYFYDERGNTVIKKTPGNAELQMVYDRRNRLILSQDGNMRSAIPEPKCNLTLYDETDRPAITALYGKLNSRPLFDFNNTVGTVQPGDVTGIFVGDLGDPSVTVLKYFYYDNHDFASVSSFDNNFHNALAYPNGPGIQPILYSERVKGFATGSRVLVLDGGSTYLNTTSYYDEEGRMIQMLSDNITGKTDIITNQYQWDGRLLSTETIHTAAGTAYDAGFSILTKNNYDKIGRVQSIEKKIGINNFKKIVSYDYDDMGRVKVKHLDPDYITPDQAEPDIETLNYTYNIHGQLDGINKDYALKTPGLYTKWGNQYGKFFGLYLGYNKKDGDGNLFDNSLLTGQVAAQAWNTLGDDEQRKYEYTYDPAGRFTSAGFWQRRDEGQTWENSKIDFSVGGDDGKITYDLNGNIQSMWQKGVLAGRQGIVEVDKLSYKYQEVPNVSIKGNRLAGVDDQGDLRYTDDNEQLGDFKDIHNPDETADYEYDENGNLIIDLNKNIYGLNNGTSITIQGQQYTSGIHYNHFDKPDEIRIDSKGTVKIIYDADGNKLSRAFISDMTGQTTVTTYIGEFVYTSSYPNGSSPVWGDLSYINFEEGRIRVMTNTNTVSDQPTSGPPYEYVQINGTETLLNAKTGVYDFYIKDNLQNVRMIVTEEYHKSKGTCTMEFARQGDELSVFTYPNASGVLIDKNFIPPGNGLANTSPWINGGNGNVVKLSKNGTKVGPATLQKVMAGDKISAQCNYFYNQTATNVSEQTGLVSVLVNGLLNAINSSSQVSSSVKGQMQGGNDILGNLDGVINNIAAPNQTETGPTLPKAYLTILFFDERFKFVNENSYSVRVSQAGDGAEPLPLTEIKAPKNGYVYIYVSNESNIPVYFDELAIVHERGRLAEENHYYPFGLKIATISSTKIAATEEGDTKNNRQYQGEFNEFDDDLGWNDFALRSYDPQIGRWLQSDPYDEFSSGYVGMGNDPINSIDPTGGSSWDWFKRLNNDGTATYKWFDGKGQGDFVGEGWEWQGKDVWAFKTVSGYFVELHDHAYIQKLEYGSSENIIKKRLSNVSWEKVYQGSPQYNLEDAGYLAASQAASTYNKRLQKEDDKTPFISSTLAITLGKPGTFAYEVEAANMKLGFESSFDEIDLIGRRGGKTIVSGEDANGVYERKTGWGVGIGVVKGNYGYKDVGRGAYQKMKEVKGFGVGPFGLEAIDGEIQNNVKLVNAKFGFVIGVEVGVEMNLPSQRWVPVPPRTNFPIRESTQSPPILLPKF